MNMHRVRFVLNNLTSDPSVEMFLPPLFSNNRIGRNFATMHGGISSRAQGIRERFNWRDRAVDESSVSIGLNRLSESRLSLHFASSRPKLMSSALPSVIEAVEYEGGEHRDYIYAMYSSVPAPEHYLERP